MIVFSCKAIKECFIRLLFKGCKPIEFSSATICHSVECSQAVNMSPRFAACAALLLFVSGKSGIFQFFSAQSVNFSYSTVLGLWFLKQHTKTPCFHTVIFLCCYRWTPKDKANSHELGTSLIAMFGSTVLRTYYKLY